MDEQRMRPDKWFEPVDSVQVSASTRSDDRKDIRPIKTCGTYSHKVLFHIKQRKKTEGNWLTYWLTVKRPLNLR